MEHGRLKPILRIPFFLLHSFTVLKSFSKRGAPVRSLAALSLAVFHGLSDRFLLSQTLNRHASLEFQNDNSENDCCSREFGPTSSDACSIVGPEPRSAPLMST